MEAERTHKEETGAAVGQEYGREKSRAASVQEKTGAAENRFTREQLLSSDRFLGRRDIVNALLSPGKKYTIAETEQEIRKYMKGKVK